MKKSDLVSSGKLIVKDVIQPIHDEISKKHSINEKPKEGVVVFRNTHSNVVTAAIDRLEFHHPVFIGNLLTLKASIHMVGNTSMDIGVRAETKDLFTGEVRRTVSAYLTYVALDERGRPKKVPLLILESVDENRRNQFL